MPRTVPGSDDSVVRTSTYAPPVNTAARLPAAVSIVTSRIGSLPPAHFHTLSARFEFRETCSLNKPGRTYINNNNHHGPFPPSFLDFLNLFLRPPTRSENRKRLNMKRS